MFSIPNVVPVADMSDEQDPVAAAVKALREKKKWTQDELAAKAGLAQGVISRIERGPNKRPNLATLTRIAAAFGVPVTAISRKHELVPQIQTQSPPLQQPQEPDSITISRKALRAMSRAWREQILESEEESPTAEDFEATVAMVAERRGRYEEKDEADLTRNMLGWIWSAQSLREKGQAVTLDTLIDDVMSRVRRGTHGQDEKHVRRVFLGPLDRDEPTDASAPQPEAPASPRPPRR